MPTEDVLENKALPRRSEDFFFDYANYVHMEHSAWDLKLVFGQLDQSATPASTELRSAITLPWLAVKVLAFYMTVNLRAFELTNGVIRVPKESLPAVLPPPTEEQLKTAPNLTEFVAEMNEFREEFFRLHGSET